MVDIRTAEPDDASKLLKIQNESLRERARKAYTEEQLTVLAPPNQNSDGYRSLIEDSSFTILVAEGVEPIGFGGFHTGDCQIHSLYVSPDSTDKE